MSLAPHIAVLHVAALASCTLENLLHSFNATSAQNQRFPTWEGENDMLRDNYIYPLTTNIEERSRNTLSSNRPRCSGNMRLKTCVTPSIQLQSTPSIGCDQMQNGIHRTTKVDMTVMPS